MTGTKSHRDPVERLPISDALDGRPEHLAVAPSNEMHKWFCDQECSGNVEQARGLVIDTPNDADPRRFDARDGQLLE
jgi:hypothetical protein